MNIVLVGLMGTGKSSVGRILASALGRPFLDTDHMVEAAAGKPVAAIFAAEGETGFRDREAAAIATAAAGDGQVIATGGGAVVNPDNRETLRRSGLVFWLDAPPAELLRRAQRMGLGSRPLLAGDDPVGRLEQLARERAEAYQATAHYRIDTDGKIVSETVAEILAIARREESRSS